jgi:hypothetical protein
MNDSKTVTLPSGEGIMKRLQKVLNDASMNSHFYPLIAEAGGRELNGKEIVTLLNFAICGFSSHFSGQGPSPIITRLLERDIPLYVEVLIDDPEVKQDVLQLYQEAQEAMKKQ